MRQQLGTYLYHLLKITLHRDTEYHEGNHVFQDIAPHGADSLIAERPYTKGIAAHNDQEYNNDRRQELINL